MTMTQRSPIASGAPIGATRNPHRPRALSLASIPRVGPLDARPGAIPADATSGGLSIQRDAFALQAAAFRHNDLLDPKRELRTPSQSVPADVMATVRAFLWAGERRQPDPFAHTDVVLVRDDIPLAEDPSLTLLPSDPRLPSRAKSAGQEILPAHVMRISTYNKFVDLLQEMTRRFDPSSDERGIFIRPRPGNEDGEASKAIVDDVARILSRSSGRTLVELARMMSKDPQPVVDHPSLLLEHADPSDSSYGSGLEPPQETVTTSIKLCPGADHLAYRKDAANFKNVTILPSFLSAAHEMIHFLHKRKNTLMTDAETQSGTSHTGHMEEYHTIFGVRDKDAIVDESSPLVASPEDDSSRLHEQAVASSFGLASRTVHAGAGTVDRAALLPVLKLLVSRNHWMRFGDRLGDQVMSSLPPGSETAQMLQDAMNPAKAVQDPPAPSTPPTYLDR
jgi:hypothetical protein